MINLHTLANSIMALVLVGLIVWLTQMINARGWCGGPGGRGENIFDGTLGAEKVKRSNRKRLAFNVQSSICQGHLDGLKATTHILQ